MRAIPLAAVSLMTLALYAPANAGILNGRVTNIFGTPVESVTVEVRAKNSSVLLPTPGNVTNASGDYAITLTNGRYDLTFVPPPTVTAHVFGTKRNGFDVPGTLNLQLPPGQILSGQVLTPLGAAVPHVALKFADPLLGIPPANIMNAVTDEAGFVNALVTPGTWIVSGEPRIDQRFAPRIFGSFDLSADRSLGTVVMPPAFLVTGTVLDPGLTPLQGAEFQVRDLGTGIELYTPADITDASGVAAFLIPAGTYDFTAVPPIGPAYASRTARNVVVAADLVLPSLALPTGVNLFAHCVDGVGVAVSGVDCNVDSLPGPQRLETPNDLSDAIGNIAVVITTGARRLAFVPPVATRLLPVVFDSVEVTGLLDLGSIVHPGGHWVSVTLREAGSGYPIPGANLDFVNLATGRTALTIGDVTNDSGFSRVTTDQSSYRLIVRAPSAAWNDVTIEDFSSLGDTSLIVELANPALVGVDHPPVVQAAGIALAAPYPNPSRGGRSLAVSFSLRQAESVRLDLIDASGRRVMTRPSERFAAGNSRIFWAPESLASGHYLLLARTSRGEIVSRPWVVLR